MNRVCVFCGSTTGGPAHYADVARKLGAHLAESGLGMVYGGGRIGLMGVAADAALQAGGEVIGVIPNELMDREIGHEELSEMHIVNTMTERKEKMAELADGFIALPGGLGTLDELFEMLTWAQLGLHDKPCGLLNVAGYYDSLLAFLEHGEEEGFIKPQHSALLLVHHDVEALLRLMGE